jgi:8-oxo-dGTP diphosphatase
MKPMAMSDGQRPQENRTKVIGNFRVGKWKLANVLAALKREFLEELGVRILEAEPWVGVEHVYPHAHVRLHFYCRRWEGEPQSLEGQAFAWQGRVAVEPVLPATIPLLEDLGLLQADRIAA